MCPDPSFLKLHQKAVNPGWPNHDREGLACRLCFLAEHNFRKLLSNRQCSTWEHKEKIVRRHTYLLRNTNVQVVNTDLIVERHQHELAIQVLDEHLIFSFEESSMFFSFFFFKLFFFPRPWNLCAPCSWHLLPRMCTLTNKCGYRHAPDRR